jgi:broad specificity phosphatase PhoE
MHILLVRHAQPAWDRDRLAVVDPSLTPLGRQQADLLASRLRHETVDRLLVSTATRAQQTAEPVGQVLRGADRQDRGWLHEIHMPRHWEGTPADEVERALSEARDRPRDLWWGGMPGGESFHDFHGRVTIGLESELAAIGVERRPDGLWEVPPDAARLLMVAHAGTNSIVLGHLLGLAPEPWEWERFACDHASITVLTTTPIGGGHIFSLRTFSDVGHLPPQLVTA